MKKERLTIFARFVLDLNTLSKCTDKQVAAIIVDHEGTQVLSIGINGGPKGGKDCLCALGGKYTCAHAEANALAKCKVDCQGATMICSLSPCVTCATLIINAGIKEVYFLTKYKDDTGLNMLLEAGVKVTDCDIPESITAENVALPLQELDTDDFCNKIADILSREVGDIIKVMVYGIAVILGAIMLSKCILG